MTDDIKKGDVLFVELPNVSKNRHEQTGPRPAVAMQDVASNDTAKPMIIVIPFTKHMSALRFKHTLKINSSPTNGLSYPSILLVFQMRAFDKRKVISKIGVIETEHLKTIENEIKDMMLLQDAEPEASAPTPEPV